MKRLFILGVISLITTNCNYTIVNQNTITEVDNHQIAIARISPIDYNEIDEIINEPSIEVESTIDISLESSNNEQAIEEQNVCEQAVDYKQYRERDYIEQIIHDVSNLYSFPELLLQAIIYAESNFNPNVVGPDTHCGNAHGLMQLLPSTAESLGVTDVFDPYQNVDAGTRYMIQLAEMYSDETYYDHLGNVLHPYEMAVMAYNWGHGNLNNHLYMHGVVVIDENSQYGIPSETYNYLLKIREYCEKGKLSYEI